MDIPKLYYSIGQVSELAGVDQHVLRYWETEFKDLAPRKNRSGKRLYKENDVKLVQRIKQLLYDERFTIEGARRRLKEEHRTHAEVQSNGKVGERDGANGELLSEIRKGLLEVRELLES